MGISLLAIHRCYHRNPPQTKITGGRNSCFIADFIDGSARLIDEIHNVDPHHKKSVNQFT